MLSLFTTLHLLSGWSLAPLCEVGCSFRILILLILTSCLLVWQVGLFDHVRFRALELSSPVQFMPILISIANAILYCVGPNAVGYLHEITFSICSLLETSCTTANEKFLQPAVACYNNSCIGTREMCECEWGRENQYLAPQRPQLVFVGKKLNRFQGVRTDEKKSGSRCSHVKLQKNEFSSILAHTNIRRPH